MPFVDADLVKRERENKAPLTRIDCHETAPSAPPDQGVLIDKAAALEKDLMGRSHDHSDHPARLLPASGWIGDVHGDGSGGY